MATKCPICCTRYEKSEEYTPEECFGEGKCPARKAGPRPSAIHVLCACNETWLMDDELMPLVAPHGYDHCEKDEYVLEDSRGDEPYCDGCSVCDVHPQGTVWAQNNRGE